MSRRIYEGENKHVIRETLMEVEEEKEERKPTPFSNLFSGNNYFDRSCVYEAIKECFRLSKSEKGSRTAAADYQFAFSRILGAGVYIHIIKDSSKNRLAVILSHPSDASTIENMSFAGYTAVHRPLEEQDRGSLSQNHRLSTGQFAGGI